MNESLPVDVSRRYVILMIEPEIIVDALMNWQQQEMIRMPLILPRLPEGATAKDVYYDFTRNCFLIRIHHESFSPVPPGQEPLIWNILGKFEYIELKDKEPCQKIG